MELTYDIFITSVIDDNKAFVNEMNKFLTDKNCNIGGIKFEVEDDKRNHCK